MQLILTTKLRRKLLTHAFSNPKESYYVREFSGLIAEDAGNLSRELRRLEAQGLFCSTSKGREKFYSLNKKYPFYRELKKIVTKAAQGLGMVLLCATLCHAEPTYVNSNDYQGVIFPASYDISAYLGKADTRFEPAEEDIEKAEGIAVDFLETYFTHHSQDLNNPSLKALVPRIQDTLMDYNRQYFGYKDAKNDKCLLINYLYPQLSDDADAWKEELVSIRDNKGTNFIIQVDITLGKVVDFKLVQ